MVFIFFLFILFPTQKVHVCVYRDTPSNQNRLHRQTQEKKLEHISL